MSDPRPTPPHGSPKTQLQDDIDANEKVREISQRSLSLAISSMAVTIMVVAIGLVGIIYVALSAQRDTDAVQAQAEVLAVELACRSQIVNEHAIAQADVVLVQAQLDIGIALGLVRVARGEPLDDLTEDMAEYTVDLEAKAQILEDAGVRRRDSVESCDES